MNSALEMAMRTFDCAVLMGDAGVITTWLHAIMSTERFVSSGHILAGLMIEIAECSGEAVAAMLARGTTESPKRVLKAFGERHEALAAKDHMAMFKTGIGKAEMVKPVIKALFSDDRAFFERPESVWDSHVA